MSAVSLPPLERLQKLLDEKNLAAYIVPSADAHQSEYVAACDKHREYISGFSGSAGTVVILNTHYQNHKHRLWTDGRYFLQAIQQLDGEKWILMKQGQNGVPKLEEWCITTFPSGSRIGIDPTVVSIAQWRAYHDTFTHASMELVTLLPNLVETVWDNRPERPHAPITVLPLSYTGMSTATKVEHIRKSLADNKIHALVITALDEVAWVFNLRGADIPFNPVFFAYALITQELVRLYVDSSQLTAEVLQHLGSAVDVKPYQAILSDLKAASSLLPIADPKCNRIWMDPTKCNYAIYSTVSSEYVYEAQSPISLMKAIKNTVELNGMRQAHIRDAAAVCNFLNWLEENIGEGKQEWNEVTVANRLEQFRMEQKDYIGLSFETISASGSSGAIIHYKPELLTCKKVDTQHMYLCDSGAQYRDGTTDITRTIHLGTPSRFETIAFTRVLQGHIGLASVIFPPDTVGPNLDAFARAPLWSSGLDYQHGTGHGVGHYLNVHEGPHGISSSTRTGSALVTPLQAGMVVTNEPGYYHEGSFGIRIESVLIVKNATTENQFLGKQFLEFETITMVPIQRKLIAIDLLTDREIAWLNQFHVACRTLVSPLLSGNALKWLHEATQPITRPQPVAETTPKPTDAPTKYY